MKEVTLMACRKPEDLFGFEFGFTNIITLSAFKFVQQSKSNHEGAGQFLILSIAEENFRKLLEG